MRLITCGVLAVIFYFLLAFNEVYGQSLPAQYQPTLLVCSKTLQPNECDVNSARLVYNGEPANSLMSCVMNTTAPFAGSSLANIGNDEYIKVICRNINNKTENVG